MTMTDVLTADRDDPTVRVDAKTWRASQIEDAIDSLTRPRRGKRPSLIEELRARIRPAIVRNQEHPQAGARQRRSDIHVSGSRVNEDGTPIAAVAQAAVALADDDPTLYDEVDVLVTGAVDNVLHAVQLLRLAEGKLLRLDQLGNVGRVRSISSCAVCGDDCLPRAIAGRCTRCYQHRRDHDHDINLRDGAKRCRTCEQERLDAGVDEGMCWRCAEDEAEGERGLCTSCLVKVSQHGGT